MAQAALIDIPTASRTTRVKAPCPEGIDPGVVRFSWPTGARHVWRKPEILSSSTWAERYRVVDASSRPGPWNNDVARYLCGPMDVFFLPFIHEIAIVAPPQTGKTEILMNCLAAAIDQAPGPSLMVYDQQSIAKRMCTTRVKKMLQLSPRLKKYITGRADDFANFLINLTHVSIPFAWATSVSELSNQPIRYLFLDEVDQYEATGKKDAGAVSLARKRTRSYHKTCKIMLASSPTVEEGEISTAYNRVQARFEYAVICPNCGVAHVMQFTGADGAGVIWPKDERNPEIIQSLSLAEYVCPHCGGVWDDFRRDQAVRRGFWRERETKIELLAYCNRHRPRSVGFQYSTLISPFVSLSETAAKFVLAQADLKVGRIDAYKDWLNGYMAETWKEDFAPRKSDTILALRDDRPAGLLPDGREVALLLGLVDTQDKGFWYEIRAFRPGQSMESWQVRAGFVDGEANFETLEKIMRTPYYDVFGREYGVSHVFIDSAGHLTMEVYDWCILNRGWATPTKGEQTMKQPYKLSKIETWPGTDKKIPGGLDLLLVHTKYYKDALHRKLQIAPADPGAWHMNSECTEDWASQMCAEYVDDRQMWVCPKHKANHAWDVSVLGLCGADFLGVRYMRPELEEDEPDEASPPSRSRMW